MRKQEIVRAYGKRHGIRIFVETGTYLGLMVQAVRKDFDQLYSLELDEALFRRAIRRLQNDPRIRLMHGDSGELLPLVMAAIQAPTLFWLDAHWSGGITARGESDTPIMRELEAVLAHPLGARHVVLIDDMEYITGGEYPAVDVVRQHIGALQPGLNVQVAENVMRITPSSDAS